MADRVAVMADGCILQIGTPTEIYERPRTRFVAEFLGTANIFPAEVLARPSPDLAVLRIRLGGAEQVLPVPTISGAVGDQVQVAVRPEKIFLNASGDGVKVTVLDHVFRGSYHAFELQTEGGGGGKIVAHRPTTESGFEASLGQGATAVLSWHPRATILLDADG